MDKDILQKAMLAAVGLAEKTKEKTHEIIDKLVKQGKLTTEEGQHILREVKDVTIKGSEEAKEKVQQGIATARQKLTFATSNEVEKLTARVGALEKKLKALEVTLLGLRAPAKTKKKTKRPKRQTG